MNLGNELLPHLKSAEAQESMGLKREKVAIIGKLNLRSSTIKDMIILLLL